MHMTDTAPALYAADSGVAAARVLDAARASSAQVELFGSFVLGGVEFALPAAGIREVVNLPARIIPVPLSPPFLEGVFTLRGHVIPVLNLARIFDPAAAAGAQQKVAIIEHDDIEIGLLFDQTGEVLRVRPEQRSMLQYRGGAAGVIAGTIELEQGARLLQVLDPNALVRIENVPQVKALRAPARALDKSRFHLQAGRRQCLSFHAGGAAFAFEMAAIREIIAVPEILPSVVQGPLCLGRINFRGHAVAVVDMAALLHPGRESGASTPAQRILVANIGAALIGLLVDSVDTLFSCFGSDVMPVPLLGAARAGMFAGCVARGDDGDILLLDHAGIFTKAELLEIGAGHINLYQKEAEAAAEAQSQAARQALRRAYIAFSLDSAWAVEIGQVREIVDFAAGLPRPPGMPGFVHGMLNLRQKMVLVVDLRTLHGLPPAVGAPARKILVIENGEERFGVIVDAVDNIVTVADARRRHSPRMLAGAAGQGEQADEVLDVPGPDDQPQVLRVFERSAFLARLAAAMPA
jgi:purine-binding chemotaxis protein CheW